MKRYKSTTILGGGPPGKIVQCQSFESYFYNLDIFVRLLDFIIHSLSYTIYHADVYELRGKNRARVYYREVDGKIEILAKSNKDNQNKVIGILQKMGY